MKILITNDDGIEAPGLKYLVDWAKNIGEVCVFAPKTQQSAKSQSIEIHGTYEVKKVDIFEGIEAYSVDSTPADCVRIAVLGMKKQFDLVLSGINCGPNLGADIHYSGTVGACFEAAMSGIKAIAVSTAYNHFENAVKNIDRVYKEIQNRRMFDFAEIINVNFPEKGEEILVTKMGPAIYSDEFEFLPDGTVKPCLVCLYKGTRNLELDTDAVMTGHISITPIRCDMTDISAFNYITKKVV
ncbi:MAG: 5'/3'-nucleotidase SurE [Clostridiales bacterium]|nr:5'/3'-nucleotidase SurE [Clostridiales bacterium]